MPKGIYSRDKQCEKCRGAGIVFNAIIRRYQQCTACAGKGAGHGIRRIDRKHKDG